MENIKPVLTMIEAGLIVDGGGNVVCPFIHWVDEPVQIDYRRCLFYPYDMFPEL